ncbi:MAG: ferritin-like domain-containing protein [Ramlibacter sp.]
MVAAVIESLSSETGGWITIQGVTFLRQHALRIVLQCDPNLKAAEAACLDLQGPIGASDNLLEPAGIPGRPARPQLVPHTQLKQRSMNTAEGRATLIHALAHIELNAIDLALDLVWRFAGMPDDFYRQWISVAKEEARHFTLLRNHLVSLGFDYGDFPAHGALWEMAEKTKGDLLARLALVPRTLEARGLDASPPIKAKLVSAGDHRAGEILDIILRDEIGHVAVGNRWYRYVCEQRSVDPVAIYAQLAARYGAPRLRGPFNLDARRAAGFEEDELRALQTE